MKKIENIIKYSYSVIISLMLLVCCAIPFLRKDFLFGNFSNLFLGIIVILIFYCISNLIVKKLSSKTEETIIKILTVVNIFLLFYISLHYCFSTGWDCKILLTNADSIAHSNFNDLSHHYFSVYPNNILITYIFSLLFRLSDALGLSNKYFILLFLQCCIYSISGYFFYKTVCILLNKTKRNYGLLSWLIYFFFVGLSPWVIIPYSDSFGLLFVTVISYFFVSYDIAKHKKINLFVIVFMSFVGYYIKPQLLILFIAISLISMIRLIKNYKTLLKYKKEFVVIILAILSAVGINRFAKSMTGFKISNEMTLGVSHFLMMGLNYESNGAYNRDDVLFSIGFNNNHDRTIANMRQYTWRLKNLGVIGLAKHLILKSLTNYNDGTFAWFYEGGFKIEKLMTFNDKMEKFLTNYFYKDGDYYIVFNTVMQMFWFGLLFFSVFIFKSRDAKTVVFALSIIGLTVFVTVFEARARYLFAYAPVYILLSTVGLNEIVNTIKKKVKR